MPIKDKINHGGYKIYTAEVESMLMLHSAVIEAAVIVRPFPILGERVHAVVVGNQDGMDVSEEELSLHCAARLADYKAPETFEIRRSLLPRNLNGKVIKKKLRE